MGNAGEPRFLLFSPLSDSTALKGIHRETGRAGEGEWVLETNRQSPWTVGSPNRHIPVDTSLCAGSAQVRIYGFVATGFSVFSCVGVDLSEDKMLKTISPTKEFVIGLFSPTTDFAIGSFHAKSWKGF